MTDISRARHYHQDLIGRALFYSGAYRRLLNDRAIVLAYHSISDDNSPISCTPKAFRNQCRFFAKYFDVITLNELIGLLKDSKSLEGKAAITFDDGYKDNSEIAADVLVKYALPATFFVVTRFIDSNHIAWWDEREGIESRWMSWDDLRTLFAAGFTIGGHTQHHVDLGSVDPDLAQKEINGCRDDLHSELGVNCELFAYPYGGPENINEKSLKFVQQAGFISCFSCHGGIINPDDNVFELLRLPISSWHVSEYHLGAQIMRDFHSAKDDNDPIRDHQQKSIDT